MRSILFRLACFVMLYALQLPAQSSKSATSLLGSIEVDILDSESAPVAGVTVRVSGQTYASTEMHRDVAGHWIEPDPSPGISITTTSDTNGRAFFDRIAPGQYNVSGSLEDYLIADKSSPPKQEFKSFLLVGDASTTGVFPVTFETHYLHPVMEIRLVRQGSIAGRVRDADGNPRPGMDVEILSLYSPSGPSRLVIQTSVTTNENGEYIVSSLLPGKYYARIPDKDAVGDPNRFPYYMTGNTYYPATREARFAEPIAVNAGSIISGVDFTATEAPKGVIVSGVVTNVFPGGFRIDRNTILRQVALALIPIRDELIEAPISIDLNSQTNDDTKFPFELRNVSPGTYDLFASFMDMTLSQGRSPRYFSGQTRIVVGEQGVTDIALEIESGAEIHGHVIVRGEDPLRREDDNSRITPILPDAMSLQLVDDNVSPGRNIPLEYFASLEGDKFTFTGVLPGKYRLELEGTPLAFGRENSYLEDIRQDGQSVNNDGLLSIDHATAEVELIFNTDGGVLRGSVSTSTNNLRNDAVVVLFPDASRRTNRMLYRDKRPMADGSFTFTGVPPGNYRVIAFDGRPKAGVTNPEFLSQYEQNSIPATAVAGTTLQVLRVPLVHITP